MGLPHTCMGQSISYSVDGSVTHGNRNAPTSVIHVSTLIFICQTWKPHPCSVKLCQQSHRNALRTQRNLSCFFHYAIQGSLSCSRASFVGVTCITWSSLPSCFLHLFPSAWHIMGLRVNSCERGCPYLTRIASLLLNFNIVEQCKLHIFQVVIIIPIGHNLWCYCKEMGEKFLDSWGRQV